MVSDCEELVPNFILNGTKVGQISNLQEIRFTYSVAIAGAGGET